MAEVGQCGDALQVYLSGAGSDGGSQSNPANSLGGFRSSTLATSRGGLFVRPFFRGVSLDYISGFCPLGEAQIRGGDGNSLWFTAPDDSEGPEVEILSGESKILPSGTPGSFVRVSRVDSTSLYDLQIFRVVDQYNNLTGMANCEDADRQSGWDTYRAVFLKSVGAGLLNGRIWVESGNLEIGFETPSSDEIQLVANEETAPTGISWNSGGNAESGLSFDFMPNGSMIGLWIHRTVDAGADNSPSILHSVRMRFESPWG